jgi:hypothetical protein
MVDQITLQTIGILLTGLTVSIAAIYYTLTLRYTRRNQELQLETRQAQLFMQIYDRFSTSEFYGKWQDFRFWEWDDYDEFMEKYGPSNNFDKWIQVNSFGAFLEGIGVLVKRKLIDPTLVDDLMSAVIEDFWIKMGPVVEEYKERTGRRSFEWIELLYNEIKPLTEE